jgi:predicted MFS family arabinose efflux permease
MLNPVAPFRVALRERNLRLLLVGLATSQAGDWLYNLALLAFVYERTHSSMWVGVTTAVRILPEVALGSLAGVLVDRMDRRPLMIGSDVVRAAGMAALALVAVAHAPIVLAPALAALCTAAGSAYPPCVVAVLPALTREEQLPAANAARISITFICIVAGPVFGALLLLLGSPAVAFAVNGATFVVGGLVVSALPREGLRRPATAESDGPVAHGILRELGIGWDALRGYRDGVVIAGAEAVASGVYGALTVLLVLLAQRLGFGSAGYGYLLAAVGAGGVLSAGLAGRAAESRRSRRALGIALLAVGAPLPLLAFSGSLAAAVLLVLVFGAGLIVSEVVVDSSLQRELDPAVFARAYGLVVPACVAAIAIGALLAPMCVAAFGLGATFVMLGFAVVAYGAFIVAREPGRRAQTTGVATIAAEQA